MDHGRIVGRPLEFLGGAQEDHGRIIGGTGGFRGEQAITTEDHGGITEEHGRPREDDGRTTALVRFCFGAGAELTRAE